MMLMSSMEPLQRIQKPLTVDFCGIKKTEVEGFRWETNRAKCYKLGAQNFLNNNDCIIAGSCIQVDMSQPFGKRFTSHVAPSLWMLLLQPENDGEVCAIGSIHTEKLVQQLVSGLPSRHLRGVSLLTSAI